MVVWFGLIVNFVEFFGVYSYVKFEEVFVEELFVYLVIQGLFVKIFFDGRYVVFDGDIFCDVDVYVGVWDIINKECVIVDQMQIIVEYECDVLFGKKFDQGCFNE